MSVSLKTNSVGEGFVDKPIFMNKAPICYENLLFVESALTLSKSADKFKYLWKPTPLVKDLWTSIVDTIVNITHTFDPFIILDFDN